MEPVQLEEASAWVRAAAPITGPLAHVQAEPWGVVYRAAVDDGFVWFKACAEPQAFEVALTASLSSRWGCVTEVLAHDADRRWLLMADAGEPFRELGNPPERWLELLPRYGELQIGEAAHVQEHLAEGTPDFRLPGLPARYETFMRAELPIEPEEIEALHGFLPRFTEMCDELGRAGIAETVQHDDLHMNNAYVKDDALRVLDWGDASFGHPFFSLFETFRFLVELNRLSPNDPWFGRLRDAYLEPWGPGHREAFDLAQRIGGLARAIAWLDQREALPAADRAGFDAGFDELIRLALRQALPP